MRNPIKAKNALYRTSTIIVLALAPAAIPYRTNAFVRDENRKGIIEATKKKPTTITSMRVPGQSGIQFGKNEFETADPSPTAGMFPKARLNKADNALNMSNDVTIEN